MYGEERPLGRLGIVLPVGSHYKVSKIVFVASSRGARPKRLKCMCAVANVGGRHCVMPPSFILTFSKKITNVAN